MPRIAKAARVIGPTYMQKRENAGSGWLNPGATMVGNRSIMLTNQQEKVKSTSTIPCITLFIICLS